MKLPSGAKGGDGGRNSGGGRNQTEWVADLNRNRWPASIGIGGRLAAEYAFKAEEIEQTLRREYRKLSEEQEKMQYARKLFFEESAQFAEFVNKARQSADYPGRMRLHHSGKAASDIIVTNRSAVTRGSSNSNNKYREADHDQS